MRVAVDTRRSARVRHPSRFRPGLRHRLTARKVTAKIAVGEGPGGMAFDGAGRRLFVANTSAGTVSVLDLETLKVVSTHDAGEGPDGLWVTSLP